MHPSRTRAGFTLIELLTVIAIIAILMGLLLPAVNVARKKADVARAKNSLTQICTAIKAYYTDYGQYPATPYGGQSWQSTNPCLTYGESSVSSGGPNNDQLFNVLRSIGPTNENANQIAENPRMVVYIDVPFCKSSGTPKEGIVPSNNNSTGAIAGTWVDPWGKQYNVRLDNGYVNNIGINDIYTNAPPGQTSISTGVLAFSFGPNQVHDSDGNSSKFDDVLSWQ